MTVDAALFQKALIFAIKAHEGVTRKGNKAPYIIHPLSVMYMAKSYKVSTRMLMLGIVSLLHDSVEDNEDITLEIIAKEFGYQIAAIIEELTNDNEEMKRMGKKEYLVHKMNNMSSYALYIKLCDRLDNISDLENLFKNPETTRLANRTIGDTEYILKNLDRKLTKSHKRIIKMIKNKLNRVKKKTYKS